MTRDRNGGPAVVEAVVDAIAQSCIFPNDNLFLRHLAKVETNDGLDPRTYNQFYSGGIWRVSTNKLQMILLPTTYSNLG